MTVDVTSAVGVAGAGVGDGGIVEELATWVGVADVGGAAGFWLEPLSCWVSVMATVGIAMTATAAAATSASRYELR